MFKVDNLGPTNISKQTEFVLTRNTTLVERKDLATASPISLPLLGKILCFQRVRLNVAWPFTLYARTLATHRPDHTELEKMHF